MVGDGAILRVFAFRPVGSESALDSRLRDELMPGFAALPGIIDTLAGRHGVGEGDERVIASIWESQEAMEGAIGQAAHLAPFGDDDAERLKDRHLDVLPLAFSVRVGRPDPPAILRVFRGQVRDRELPAYAEEARAGTLADAGSNDGLIALYLGLDPPTRFVTVSAWSRWDAIELATGGNVRRPIATRNASRIVQGTAEHYEIIPNTERPARAGAMMVTETSA